MSERENPEGGDYHDEDAVPMSAEVVQLFPEPGPDYCPKHINLKKLMHEALRNLSNAQSAQEYDRLLTISVDLTDMSIECADCDRLTKKKYLADFTPGWQDKLRERIGDTLAWQEAVRTSNASKPALSLVVEE